jgi:cyanate permease
VLTLPVVVPALGGGWRAALAFWAIPTALIAWAVYAYAPRFADPFRAARARRASGCPTGIAASCGGSACCSRA